ncbi:MAG TPA: hypothetical protein VKM93_23070 [Terriglobia bacterium]|nr:hypothetical protein [Terriglobia bacterium]
MPRTYSPLPQSPIVDTNILFDHLVWRFHTETRTALHLSLLQYLAAMPLDVLRRYLDAAMPIQTSFHVVAELYGLTKKKPDWSGPTRESFWRFAREELLGIELREHGVPIEEMNPEDLALLGPTDASILVLAVKLEASVLTIDGSLRGRCVRRGIEVLNYDTVVDLLKQGLI